MSTCVKCVFLVLLLPILLASAMAMPSRCALPADEMEVISAYLSWSVHSDSPTVLVTTTETSNVDIDYVNLRLATRGLGIPTEARNDLKRKDAQACVIDGLPRMRNLKLLLKSDHDAMFQGHAAWTRFHARFGKDARLSSVSRVGFSADKRFAIFYATGGLGPMAGSSYLYVFEKQGGNWVKRAEELAWST